MRFRNRYIGVSNWKTWEKTVSRENFMLKHVGWTVFNDVEDNSMVIGISD